jgi:hypothetical protein
MSTMVEQQPTTRTRLVALRIAAALFAAIVVVGSNAVLLMPLIGLLPDRGLDGMGASDLKPEIVHGVGIGLAHLILVIGIGIQIARPARWVAPLWLASFEILVMMVYDATQGTVGNPIWWVVYGLVVLVVLLHPRRIAPLAPWHAPSLLLSAVAAIPVVLHAAGQLRLQFGPVDSIGHVAGNHFLSQAGIAVTGLVAAVLGASSVPGRRLVATAAAAIPVFLGAASLVHPANASALGRPWALAAIVWGLAYAAIALPQRAARPATPR